MKTVRIFLFINHIDLSKIGRIRLGRSPAPCGTHHRGRGCSLACAVKGGDPSRDMLEFPRTTIHERNHHVYKFGSSKIRTAGHSRSNQGGSSSSYPATGRALRGGCGGFHHCRSQEADDVLRNSLVSSSAIPAFQAFARLTEKAWSSSGVGPPCNETSSRASASICANISSVVISGRLVGEFRRQLASAHYLAMEIEDCIAEIVVRAFALTSIQAGYIALTRPAKCSDSILRIFGINQFFNYFCPIHAPIIAIAIIIVNHHRNLI